MAPRRPGGAGVFPRSVEPPSAPRPDPAQLYAALDLGTNSCRMLIAQPKGSQFHVVDSFSKSVQLGLGLEASGRLSRASMARTVQALQICRRKIEQHEIHIADAVKELRRLLERPCFSDLEPSEHPRERFSERAAEERMIVGDNQPVLRRFTQLLCQPVPRGSSQALMRFNLCLIIGESGRVPNAK